MSAAMTARERGDLCLIVRRREKYEKTAATQRTAELLADFERQLASIYTFDNDATWKAAHAAAAEATVQAQAAITARCAELGIPKEFAPGVSMGWYGRGENASTSRRSELRTVAVTRLDALEKAARTQIERRSIQIQENIVRDGITSDAAKEFLSQLPAIASLMPPLDVKALADSIRKPSRVSYDDE